MALLLTLAALAFLSARFLNGIGDTLQFHYPGSWFDRTGKNAAYWNPAQSWRRKYKNGDPKQGPAFPLSTTALVMFTDGWHLVKAGKLAAERFALVLVYAAFTDHALWAYAVIWAALSVLGSAAFHLSYSLLFGPKDEIEARSGAQTKKMSGYTLMGLIALGGGLIALLVAFLQ